MNVYVKYIYSKSGVDITKVKKYNTFSMSPVPISQSQRWKFRLPGFNL